VLSGERLRLRPGDASDVDALYEIRCEPAVARWWGHEPRAVVAQEVLGHEDAVTLVIEVGGRVAGAIQYHEELTAAFRHAGIDIFLGERWQGRGLGREAIELIVRHLIEDRGHHRITIDPGAANEAAISCYASVGFRPVGVLREYQLMDDGRWHDGLLMDLLASDRA
jgi:aminoglycoside 6'-N-acetyltransferase